MLELFNTLQACKVLINSSIYFINFIILHPSNIEWQQQCQPLRESNPGPRDQSVMP